MVQLNLLPDVKLQYIKARQRKRLVISISVITAGFFLVILLVLFSYVHFAQQGHIGRLNEDIKTKTSELQEKEDLNKILTIQSQLNSLPGLHNQKVISSRMFDYLTQLTPVKATISEVNVDFAASTITIKGNADELSVVNKFADTLKFTGYTTNKKDESPEQCSLGNLNKNEGDSQEQETICRAFSEVVLSEFAIGENLQEGDKPISYDLSFKFDATIFANIEPADGKQPVVLRIPKIISTRSVTEKPTEKPVETPIDLFAPQPVIPEEEQQ